VREILTAIAVEAGYEVPRVIKPRRLGDPIYLIADPTAAREVLKFRAEHSDLAIHQSNPVGLAPDGSPAENWGQLFSSEAGSPPAVEF